MRKILIILLILCSQLWSADTVDTIFVTASNRDGRYLNYSSTASYTYTTLVMGNNSLGSIDLGVSFFVTIDQGTSIDSAYVVFISDALKVTDDCNVTIIGEDTANSSAFTTTWSDYTDRIMTSSSVAWNAIDHWEIGDTVISPNVGSVVEEIVGRSDWSSGNAVTLYFKDNGSSQENAADRRPASWDDITYDPPRLIIWYQSGEEARKIWIRH